MVKFNGNVGDNFVKPCLFKHSKTKTFQNNYNTAPIDKQIKNFSKRHSSKIILTKPVNIWCRGKDQIKYKVRNIKSNLNWLWYNFIVFYLYLTFRCKF